MTHPFTLNPTKEVYMDFLRSRSIPNPLAVTLTLKQNLTVMTNRGSYTIPLNRDNLERTVRHFLNKLNRSTFGKSSQRYGKRLSVVPVIEYGPDTRWHVHMMLEKPDRMNLERFQETIKHCWTKTKFGYEHMVIEPAYDQDGWLGYMLKNRTKPDGLHDSIDWNITYLP